MFYPKSSNSIHASWMARRNRMQQGTRTGKFAGFYVQRSRHEFTILELT